MYSGIRLLHLSITYKLGSSKPKWHGSKSTNQNQQTRAFKLVEVNCSLLRGPLWWLMQQNTKQVIEQSSHFLERLCTITLQKWDNYFFVCVTEPREVFVMRTCYFPIRDNQINCSSKFILLVIIFYYDLKWKGNFHYKYWRYKEIKNDCLFDFVWFCEMFCAKVARTLFLNKPKPLVRNRNQVPQ